MYWQVTMNCFTVTLLVIYIVFVYFGHILQNLYQQQSSDAFSDSYLQLQLFVLRISVRINLSMHSQISIVVNPDAPPA